MRLAAWLLLLLIGPPAASSTATSVETPPPAATVVLTMILRDETDNVRANLPKFRNVVDAVVCGIDDRTGSTATARAVAEALPDTPRWCFYYHFRGFGDARTRVLREAWAKFAGMSHVLVADPDWEPDLATIRKSDLDFHHTAFAFTIFDRNSQTTRQAHWIVRHGPNLTFSYRLHEQLNVPPEWVDATSSDPGAPVKSLTWTVHEVEVKDRESWHTKGDDAHGHSQSYTRYLFDLELLHADEAELGDDPHVQYYVGATTFAALEALCGRGQRTITSDMPRGVSGANGSLHA